MAQPDTNKTHPKNGPFDKRGGGSLWLVSLDAVQDDEGRNAAHRQNRRTAPHSA